MGTKTKVAVAAGCFAAVAAAAAAFGQSGSSDGTPSPGQSGDGSARSAAHAERCGREHPRKVGRLVHGDLTVKTKNGFAFLTIDQGRITAIDRSARTMTVERQDGQSVTVTATDRTRVCLDGHPSSFDSLKTGDLARTVQVRSERFTGLRRIWAITPDSAQQAGSPSSLNDGNSGVSQDQAA